MTGARLRTDSRRTVPPRPRAGDCQPGSPTFSNPCMEQVFREMKSLLETRSVFHRTDESIQGHVFEWADIKMEPVALDEITIEENGRKFSVRTECRCVCGKVFQAVRVAIPQVIREVTPGCSSDCQRAKCGAERKITGHIVPKLRFYLSSTVKLRPDVRKEKIDCGKKEAAQACDSKACFFQLNRQLNWPLLQHSVFQGGKLEAGD